MPEFLVTLCDLAHHSDRPTLAPRKNVMAFITSTISCYEFAFGTISCNPYGCAHVYGHILPGYDAAIVQTWLDRNLGLRVGGRSPRIVHYRYS